MTRENSRRISKYMDWMFYALLSYAALTVTGDIKEMRSSVNELNIKMAIVLEKNVNYDIILQKQDDRLRILERSAK